MEVTLFEKLLERNIVKFGTEVEILITARTFTQSSRKRLQNYKIHSYGRSTSGKYIIVANNSETEEKAQFGIDKIIGIDGMSLSLLVESYDLDLQGKSTLKQLSEGERRPGRPKKYI